MAAARLGRDDIVVLACLALAAGLAWAWLGRGAGMATMPAAPWSAGYLAAAFAMWAVMMVAMMLPSATPMILLHARVARQGRPGPLPAASAAFALAYVLVWSGFALAAALAQAALVAAGAMSAMTLALGQRLPVAALLALAALYQLSRAKQACLDKCRSPLAFIVAGYRRGPFRLGLAHGAYCLGCCWALMLLLFVGGAMNLAWVAGLGIAVLAEKYGPAWTGKAVAAALFAAAALAATGLA